MNRNKTLAFTALAAVAIGAITATQLQSQVKPGAMLQSDNSTIVAVGQQIYSENCAACHGVKLEGQKDWRSPNAEGRMPAPPHDPSGHTWHHTDDLLFSITKNGLAKLLDDDTYKTDMPVYDGVLSDDEIIAVLSYIKSTWPKNIRDRHDQMNAQKAGQ